MYACMHVSMQGCKDAWMHGCKDVWMYGCMYESFESFELHIIEVHFRDEKNVHFDAVQGHGQANLTSTRVGNSWIQSPGWRRFHGSEPNDLMEKQGLFCRWYICIRVFEGLNQ